jgi:flagellar M-ring protein FliF
VKETWDKLLKTWSNLSLNNRVLLVIVTVGVLVAVGATWRWANQATYTTLYTDLAPEEAGEIVDELTTLGISYKLSSGGTAILVPDGEAQEVRVKMASLGYPRGGIIGYEIFDQSNLGMTDFLQKVNFRRALEGEIAKSIMSLSEVAAARVHLVIPESRLYSRDQKEPTASVVLKLNRSLSPGQVSAIEHLVAASVEGLDPANIALVDYRGKLLSAGYRGDEETRLSSTQLDLRKNVERHLEQKAQSMLDGTLGSGTAVVRVIADLNFDKVERSAETYDPDQVAIRSEETTTSRPGDGEAGGNQNAAITNYEISKSVERVVSAYGTVKRLSVAVMVDGHYTTPAGAAEDAPPVYEPRGTDELQKIGAIVRTAVGFDSVRSDRMEIMSLAFDTRALEDTRQGLDTVADYQFYYDVGKRVILGLIVLAVLFYVRKVIKHLGKAIGSAGTVAKAPLTGTVEAALSAEPQRVRATDVFGDRARGRPDEVAKIIKTMMVE